jgi:multisubunit Na+/H+ antiporter MnhC subunit
MNSVDAHKKTINILLKCGIFGSLLYPIADIIAGNLYNGYSFNEQTVSELFAIGAPTSQLVVTLFTISSLLFIAFAFGIWLLSNDKRILRLLSLMIFGNAVNSLILWNFFPMHMRGIQPSFTDTMHGILAINPFVLVSIILGAVYFKNWFRYYSIATVLLLIVMVIFAIPKALLVYENRPTPGLGIMERASQYGHQLWHAILAVVLLYRHSGKT